MFCVSIKWSNEGNLDNLSSVSFVELSFGIGYINDLQEEKKVSLPPPYSPVENKNDLELDFKVFFFTDSCCSDIVHDESN